MRRTRWTFALLSILVLITCASGTPYQQRTPDGRYFPQTGFTVKGEFLKMFDSSDSALDVFGLPISGELKDALRPGIQVQYFQKARMDMDANAPEGQRVTLAPLGTWLKDNTEHGADANIDITSGACYYFAQTRFFVCFAFMQFYEGHNGAVLFGQPISTVELDGGRLVQYFERARMEWWPENQPGKRVELTDIGTLDYRNKVGNPQQPDPNIIGRLEKLVVHIFPAKPLLSTNETQTLFVIVQDQLYRPVGGALVKIVVSLPDGTQTEYRLAETNLNGITRLENIPAGKTKPNQMVRVDATVSLLDVQTVVVHTWYRIWW